MVDHIFINVGFPFMVFKCLSVHLKDVPILFHISPTLVKTFGTSHLIVNTMNFKVSYWMESWTSPKTRTAGFTLLKLSFSIFGRS